MSDTIEPVRGTAASDGAPKNPGGEATPASLTQAVRWRVPTLAAPHPPSLSRNPSLPTFVALMILILTFFIVLTNVSLHDKTKSKVAIASVQEAFGNLVTTEEVAKKDEEIARDYIADLTQRIQSLVPLMGGKPAPASDHQVLWLPTDLAFPSENAALAPLFPTILREIVKSLDGIPQRLTPHIEMRLCATEPGEQLRARAVAIGAALSIERAPLGQFSIGVMPCDPKRIGIAIALAPAAEERTQ